MLNSILPAILYEFSIILWENAKCQDTYNARSNDEFNIKLNATQNAKCNTKYNTR